MNILLSPHTEVHPAMNGMFAILFSLVVIAHAEPIGHAGLGGVSHSSRKQDDYGNYAFQYDIVNHHGATNGRSEVGGPHGHVVGSYHLGDIDGRARKVHYEADDHGFRAVVKTNEPGTAHSHPAAVEMDSTHHGVPAGGAYSHHGGYGGHGYGHGPY